ncbi:MAG: hypothetical protein ACR2PA_02355 [Hyphomicrobiaceae bacterium]
MMAKNQEGKALIYLSIVLALLYTTVYLLFKVAFPASESGPYMMVAVTFLVLFGFLLVLTSRRLFKLVSRL